MGARGLGPGWRRKIWMGAPSERLEGDDVAQVVVDLCAISHTSAWERTLAIGQVVFRGIFAGDTEEWRARRGNKSISLRKLVTHPQCPFKKSALSAAVNVFLFVREQPGVQTMPNVTPTHVSCVCSVPTPMALELLADASASGWTVRELTLAIKGARPRTGAKRGRPLVPKAERAETIGRHMLAAIERMQALLSEAEHVDEACRARLRHCLQSLSEACARVEALPQLTVPLKTALRPRKSAVDLEPGGLGAA